MTYKNGSNLLANQRSGGINIIICQEVYQMLDILDTHGKSDADAEGTVIVYVHYGQLRSDDAVIILIQIESLMLLKLRFC